MINNRLLLKTFLGVSGISFLIQLISLMTGVILARSLGAEGRGELAAVMLWPTMIANFAIMGNDISLSRFVARKEENIKESLYHVLVFSFSLGVVGMVVGYITINTFMPENKHYLVVQSSYVLLSIVPSIGVALLSTINLAVQNYKYYNIFRISFTVSYFLLVLALYVMNEVTPTLVVFSFVAAAYISYTLSIILSYKNSKIPTKHKLLIYKILLKNGIPFSGITILNSIYVAIGGLLLISLSDVESLGKYTVALVLASGLTFITSSISKVLYSISINGREDSTWISDTLRQLLIISIFLFIISSLTLPSIMPVLFGDEFKDSKYILIALIITILINANSMFIEEILKAKGISKSMIKNKIISLILIACSAYFIVPKYNLYGLALSLIMGSLFIYIVMVRSMARFCKKDIRYFVMIK